MKLGGILRGRKSSEKKSSKEVSGITMRDNSPSTPDTNSPITVNYSAVDALRQGVRAFQGQKEVMNEAAKRLEEKDEEGIFGGGDDLWDVFESEKEEDLYLQNVLGGLQDINIFDLVEECQKIAVQLQRRA